MEVREVYESEMEKTMMLDGKKPPKVESRENNSNSMMQIIDTNTPVAEESQKGKSQLLEQNENVLVGHSSQGQILTNNDHEESDEENVIMH